MYVLLLWSNKVSPWLHPLWRAAGRGAGPQGCLVGGSEALLGQMNTAAADVLLWTEAFWVVETAVAGYFENWALWDMVL